MDGMDLRVVHQARLFVAEGALMGAHLCICDHNSKTQEDQDQYEGSGEERDHRVVRQDPEEEHECRRLAKLSIKTNQFVNIFYLK